MPTANDHDNVNDPDTRDQDISSDSSDDSFDHGEEATARERHRQNRVKERARSDPAETTVHISQSVPTHQEDYSEGKPPSSKPGTVRYDYEYCHILLLTTPLLHCTGNIQTMAGPKNITREERKGRKQEEEEKRKQEQRPSSATRQGMGNFMTTRS